MLSTMQIIKDITFNFVISSCLRSKRKTILTFNEVYCFYTLIIACNRKLYSRKIFIAFITVYKIIMVMKFETNIANFIKADQAINVIYRL